MYALDLALVGQSFKITPGGGLADGELFHNVRDRNALALGNQLKKLDLTVGAGDEVVLHIYPHSIEINHKTS
jgi:hypothetical protein